MPRMDGSGPEGKGPKTGRGLGNCSGTNTNTNLQRNFLGLRLGFGRKRRRGSVNR